MVRRILACAVFALAGGCSILTSLDGLSSRNDDETPGGDGGGPDGTTSASDAGDGATASDAPSDTGSNPDALVDSGADSEPSLPNLHPNGSFEANIMPWGAYQGAVTQTTSRAPARIPSVPAAAATPTSTPPTTAPRSGRRRSAPATASRPGSARPPVRPLRRR